MNQTACRASTVSVRATHLSEERLLGVIRKQIENARSMALPWDALSKACNYTLTLWDKVTRFLEYPALELSNRLAENSMRPVAIGAGPKIAAILSVVHDGGLGHCLFSGLLGDPDRNPGPLSRSGGSGNDQCPRRG